MSSQSDSVDRWDEGPGPTERPRKPLHAGYGRGEASNCCVPKWALDYARAQYIDNAYAPMHNQRMATTTDNAHICITAEMAVAVGRIASAHQGTITVYWDDNDPQNVWRVNVDEADKQIQYVVDDESGLVDPELATRTVILTAAEQRWLLDAAGRIGSRYDDPEPRSIYNKLANDA
jgi:hypothetical protein